MAITDIRLQMFRSYKDTAFELDPGVNIVVGPNASGKTNLLEAVLMIALGKSYRAGNEELIKFSQPWARLQAHTQTSDRVVKVTNEPIVGKTFEIDGQTFKRLPASKKLPVVLFEPQHLLILSGRPELRRDYLDDLLEQLEPGFGKIRRDYKRSLAQRNFLLKQDPGRTKSQLFAWNIRLSELGGNIVDYRRQLIERLNQDLAGIYKQLSASQALAKLDYVSVLPVKNYVSSLLHQLENNVEQDYRRGFTGFGPHRDDLAVSINDHPAQESASRGEMRTLVLALKVLEIDCLEKANNQQPMILLDDVFSELDGARRRALTQYLKDYQTFITTTDADVVVHNFAQKCNVITLS